MHKHYIQVLTYDVQSNSAFKKLNFGDELLVRKKTVPSYLCKFPAKIPVISFCLLVLLFMSSPAFAEVTEITISPQDPSPGDTVTITGKASPNEEIKASVSFGNSLDVSGNTFEYNIGKVTIPVGSDSFSLRAEGVDNLDISVKLLGIPLPVPSRYISINDNVATFGTGKIKSGTYDIKLSGSSSADQVLFSFGAKATIVADQQGNFEYTYDTNNIPDGTFNINIGGEVRQLSIGKTDAPSSPSAPSGTKSSSKTGTDLNIVPADTLDDAGETGDVDEQENARSPPNGNRDSPENTVDPAYVEGYELESESAGIREKLPDIGQMGLVLGVLCMLAIAAGYRKNRYK
ncbi:MAG: hypothetical protein QCH31_06940 [Methanolobus sp.]|nr:hypothetical protein [Methanolobus sp.]